MALNYDLMSEIISGPDPEELAADIAGSINPPDLSEELTRYRAQQSDSSFRRRVRENQRKERLIERQGGEVPEPEEPGLLSKILHTISIPGYAARGAGAALFNAPGYEDKNFIEGAKQGIQEELGTSDILAKYDVLDDYPITRAGVGFVGDVLSDPIGWISPTGLIGKKVGGKIISSTGDDVLRALKGKKLEAAAQQLFGKGPDALTAAQKAAVEAKAHEELGSAFRQAANLTAEARKQKRLVKHLPEVKKFLTGTGDVDEKTGLLTNTLKKTQELRSRLGVADDFDLDTLFEKPALKLASPLAGLSRNSRIPLVGADSLSIPLVTKYSRDLYSKLGDTYYSVSLPVGEFVAKAIKAGKDSDNPFAKAGAAIAEAAASVPKALSRRVLSGGRAPKERIDEQVVHMGAIYQDVNEQTMKRFGAIPLHVREQIPLLIQAGLRTPTSAEVDAKMAQYAAQGLKADPAKVRAIMDEEIQAIAVHNALKRLQQQNPDLPGIAEQTKGVLDEVIKDYAEFAQKEGQAGILEWTVDGYINAMYEQMKGLGKDKVEAFRSAIGSTRPGFTFSKTFSTLAEASKAGLNPTLDIAELWKKRKLAHEFGMSAVKFYDNMRFEFGVPKELKARIVQMLSSNNKDLVEQGTTLARQLGYRFSTNEADPRLLALGITDDIAKELKTFTGDTRPILQHEGTLITPNMLASWERAGVAEDLLPYEEIARKNNLPHTVSTIGMTDDGREIKQLLFSDDLKADLAKIEPYQKAYNENLTGRLSEFIGDRAATDYAPDPILKLAEKHFGKDEKFYYSNLLPAPVVDGLRDALDTRSTAKKYLESSAVDGSVKGALKSITRDGYLPFLRLHKWVNTIPFVAYHGRNFTSVFPLRLNALSQIGGAMNVPKIVDRHIWKRGKGVLKTPDGFEYTYKQLEPILRAHGIQTHPMAEADILETMAGSIQAWNLDKTEAAKAVAEVSKRRGFLTRLSQGIETWGREHLFYDLLEKGYDPSSAAREVGRVFTDYTHGKTQFEKHFLNNLFFFYSFGRRQSANTLISLATRPGAITGQIHMRDAVAKAFTDYEDPPLPPDLEDSVRSLRSFDAMAKYIGRDKIGRPEFLAGLGLPMEEVGKWVNLQTPKNWLNLMDYLEAAGDNAGRVAQTTLAMTNPILKGPVELLLTKRNTFFDRPITDRQLARMSKLAVDVPKILSLTGLPVAPKQMLMGLDKLTQEILKPVDNGDGTVTVDPAALAALSVMIPGMGRAASMSANLARQDKSAAARLGRFFSGVRTNSIDPERSTAYQRGEQLDAFMERQGLAKTKSRARLQRTIDEANEVDQDDNEDEE